MSTNASETSGTDLRPSPHYVEIGRILSQAIESGGLAHGTVLTEGVLAALFGTSRTPVRTALAQLLDDGAVSRFDGRGFVVGQPGASPPARIKLTRQMLGLSPREPSEPKPASARRIEGAFEDSIVAALPFGLFRINEQGAADYFGVSRNVVRESLSRFQDRGLVRKDRKSHWVTGPLTARDVAHFFAIRGQLEPLALTDSAPSIPPEEIERMRHDIDMFLSDPNAFNPQAFEALEQDLHVKLLSRSRNSHLLRMIRQTHIALVVNTVFARVLGATRFDVALREHAIVLDFVMRGSHDAAAKCLEEHIRLSAERTRQRLISISVFPEPQLPAYLQKQGP